MKVKKKTTVQESGSSVYISTKITKATCNCCLVEFTSTKDPFDVQEVLHWENVGGYGSIFGDQSHIEITLCQDCIKKILGPYLIVKTRTF